MAWDTVMRSVESNRSNRIPYSGRLWVQLLRLLALMTLLTGTVSVFLYANVVRVQISRLTPETREAMTRDFGLPPGTFQKPRPFEAIRSQFIEPMVVSLVFGSITCLLVSLLVARRFARPLEHLTQTAQRLARGDLSARTPALPGPGEVARLIENVNEMAARLEHYDAERRASSAAIAHELRTPLASLRMRVAGLEEGVYPLEAGEVGKLHRQIDVLSRLADDLQTLTLADVDGLGLRPSRLDLSALTREVLEDMQPRFEAKRLQVQLDSSGATLVQADPERLGQVLNNLLENAARYAPDADQIRLEIRQVNARVHFTIQNSSRIDTTQITQLFERFYRSEASRARESGGSGLGLAIVRAIIEAHAGHVWARAIEPDRLEVGFELPAA
jgi:two-component system, OmpR family, sensor histidine kinase BaeS